MKRSALVLGSFVLLTLVAILVRVNRLQEDALFDAVTGLRNHRYFQVRLREELRRSDRTSKPTALLMIDLDNFKGVNDTFGHLTGSKTIEEIGFSIMTNLRSGDAAARFGGDEFAARDYQGSAPASLCAPTNRQSARPPHRRHGRDKVHRRPPPGLPAGCSG